MVRVVMVPGWVAKVRAAMTPWHHGIVDDVARDVRANIIADGTIDTGAMLASVRRQGQRVYIGGIADNHGHSNHWYFIEYGTSAHIITPNTKKALSWPGLPHPVKLVRHPGNKEYAPMRRALYKKR